MAKKMILTPEAEEILRRANMPEEKARELKGRETNVEALSAEDLDKVSGGSFSVGPGAATGFFGGCCLVRESLGTLQYWIAPPHEMYGDLHWVEVDAGTFHNYYLLLSPAAFREGEVARSGQRSVTG